MRRKQDIFRQKTETVIRNTKNSFENVKGLQIKGLNRGIKVTIGMDQPIHPHMEKTYTKIEVDAKRDKQKELKKVHKPLAKKRGKGCCIMRLFSPPPLTISSTLRTRHTHENNYRHSLHTDSFLLLEILYTFTSRRRGR